MATYMVLVTTITLRINDHNQKEVTGVSTSSIAGFTSSQLASVAAHRLGFLSPTCERRTEVVQHTE